MTEDVGTETQVNREGGNCELPHVYDDVISTEEFNVKRSDENLYRQNENSVFELDMKNENH